MTYANAMNNQNNETVRQINWRKYLTAIKEAVHGQLILNKTNKEDNADAEELAILYATQVAHQRIRENLEKLFTDWRESSETFDQIFAKWQKEEEGDVVDEVNKKFGGHVPDSVTVAVESMKANCELDNKCLSIDRALETFHEFSNLAETTGNFLCEGLALDNAAWTTHNTKAATAYKAQEQVNTAINARYDQALKIITGIGFTLITVSAAIFAIGMICAAILASPLMGVFGLGLVLTAPVAGGLTIAALGAYGMCIGVNEKKKGEIKDVPSAVLAQSQGLFALTHTTQKENKQADIPQATPDYLSQLTI